MKLTPARLTIMMILVFCSLVTSFIAKRLLVREVIAVRDASSDVPPRSTEPLRDTVDIAEVPQLGSAPPEVQGAELRQPGEQFSGRAEVGPVVSRVETPAEPTSDVFAPVEPVPAVATAGRVADGHRDLPEEEVVVEPAAPAPPFVTEIYRRSSRRVNSFEQSRVPDNRGTVPVTPQRQETTI